MTTTYDIIAGAGVIVHYRIEGHTSHLFVPGVTVENGRLVSANGESAWSELDIRAHVAALKKAAKDIELDTNTPLCRVVDELVKTIAGHRKHIANQHQQSVDLLQIIESTVDNVATGKRFICKVDGHIITKSPGPRVDGDKWDLYKYPFLKRDGVEFLISAKELLLFYRQFNR